MWRLGVYISLMEPEAVEPVPEPLPPGPPSIGQFSPEPESIIGEAASPTAPMVPAIPED
jgi:hypothetical protein